MTKDKANIEEIKIKIQNICMDTENEMNFDRATVYMDFTQKIAEYIAEDYTPNSQIQQSNEKYLAGYIKSLKPFITQKFNDSTEEYEEIEYGHRYSFKELVDKAEQYKLERAKDNE